LISPWVFIPWHSMFHCLLILDPFASRPDSPFNYLLKPECGSILHSEWQINPSATDTVSLKEMSETIFREASFFFIAADHNSLLILCFPLRIHISDSQSCFPIVIHYENELESFRP
jgi:hypothetical protein